MENCDESVMGFQIGRNEFKSAGKGIENNNLLLLSPLSPLPSPLSLPGSTCLKQAAPMLLNTIKVN